MNSLPEILVALFSSSLLISTLMSQYVGVKQHYKRSEMMLEKSLDAQLVVDLLRDSIRQAGFTPCLGVEHLSTMDMRYRTPGLTAINVFAKQKTGFQVNHMSNQYGLLTHQTSLTRLVVTKEAKFSLRHPVMIADCYHAEVHQIKHLRSDDQHWEIDLNRPLFYDYQPPIYIAEWLEEGFFIKSDALYYRFDHSEVLSDAIHNMSVSLKEQGGQRLLRVVLAVVNDRPIEVDTLLRTV